MSWIVQFDPPKEPDFFVHRVGRTARAGRTGKALILLLKSELEFVDFLTVRGIPITEWKDDEMIENTTTTTRKVQSEYLTRSFRNLAMSDRDVMDHGVRAFVSFVRAYKCHILKHIFSFENLELGHLAMMFGLLQLPKMPELKDSDTLIGYTEMKDVDIDSIPYKNKHREKQRQKQLKIRKEQEKKRASSTSSSRNTKKQQKKSQDSSSKDNKKKKRKRKGKNKRMIEEWNALQKEERLYKRLKKGKITKDEYERLIRGLDEEEEKRALRDGDSSGDEDFSSKKRRKKKNHRYNNRKKWFRSNK